MKLSTRPYTAQILKRRTTSLSNKLLNEQITKLFETGGRICWCNQGSPWLIWTLIATLLVLIWRTETVIVLIHPCVRADHLICYTNYNNLLWTQNTTQHCSTHSNHNKSSDRLRKNRESKQQNEKEIPCDRDISHHVAYKQWGDNESAKWVHTNIAIKRRDSNIW